MSENSSRFLENFIGRYFLLRGAIASVALSHEANCDCVVCRASHGDERAMAEVMSDLERPKQRP
jgi:hypothetical protein